MIKKFFLKKGKNATHQHEQLKQSSLILLYNYNLRITSILNFVHINIILNPNHMEWHGFSIFFLDDHYDHYIVSISIKFSLNKDVKPKF